MLFVVHDEGEPSEDPYKQVIKVADYYSANRIIIVRPGQQTAQRITLLKPPYLMEEKSVIKLKLLIVVINLLNSLFHNE